MVAEVGVAVTSAGVPGSTAPSSVPPGNAAPGAGAQEPFASGVGGPFGGELSAARPQLIRALNGRLLLGHIRDLGLCSRAELARISGLSKPTVSVALADAERAGLVRTAGQRTGRPGRSAPGHSTCAGRWLIWRAASAPGPR
jgi:DNA-binding transcriptional ArsR family regulator